MAQYSLMKHQRKGVKFLKKMDGVAALLFEPGVGKQQPVSEPVLTPNGWVALGDIKPGDKVIAMDGTATEVESVHPQEERTVYKVLLNDGSFTYAGPDHLWLARTHNDAVRGKGYRVVTTSQMLDAAHQRWEIPMTQPVDLPETSTIDAYLAGVIAGDGCVKSRGVELCTDTEIIEALGYTAKPHETSEYTSYAYVPVADHKHLFEGQKTADKALPEGVVNGSIEQRIAALQGLFDTDGTPVRTGGVEFSTVSETLFEQAKWLVESLGGSVRVGRTRVPSYTHNGEKREGQVSYRFNAKMPAGIKPFRLQRKLDAWVEPTKYPVKRCVKSIEFSHEEDSVCIRVKHATHTYLTRSCIVTHNTGTTLAYMDTLADKYGHLRVLVVSPLTAADTWVLQAPLFLDSPCKSRMMQGRTADLLPKISAAREWGKTPKMKIGVDHEGSLEKALAGNKITILSMSAGSISSWCSNVGEVSRAQRTAQMKTAIRKYDPHLIVVDESHIIKSDQANISLAMSHLGTLAPHRIILTGTVMPHSPLDVYGQWRFLAPWTFSAYHGKKKTKKPHKLSEKDLAELRPWAFGRFKAKYAQMGGFEGKQVMGFINLDDLQARIAERSMVVRKRDALDLPPIMDSNIYVTPSPAERKAYKDMKDELLAKAESGELIEAPNALSKLMKLRQITAGFIKDTETGEYHVLGSSKIKALKELTDVQLVSEDRIVVFAYFKFECARIAEALAKKGRVVEVITGDTKPKDRLEIRTRFKEVDKNPTPMIMVAQAKTMAVSVNELVTACHAIYMSYSEQRDVWQQSRDRLDRNGQTRPVTFWNILVKESVDEIMLETHRGRGDLEAEMLKHIRSTTTI